MALTTHFFRHFFSFFDVSEKSLVNCLDGYEHEYSFTYCILETSETHCMEIMLDSAFFVLFGKIVTKKTEDFVAYFAHAPPHLHSSEILKNGGVDTCSEEVYPVYKRAEWREEKQRDVRSQRESSFEFMSENDFDGQAAADHILVDEIVVYKLLLAELYAALAELTDDEQNLINRKKE